MQPQIPTPATFFFDIVTHPHLGGVISPSRARGAPTTAPKQPDIPPKMTHFPYHVFKRLKWCHATTNTHTSQIFLHHTNSSTSGRGNFPIQGPPGPHHSPKTARHTPQNDPFSMNWIYLSTGASLHPTHHQQVWLAYTNSLRLNHFLFPCYTSDTSDGRMVFDSTLRHVFLKAFITV